MFMKFGSTPRFARNEADSETGSGSVNESAPPPESVKADPMVEMQKRLDAMNEMMAKQQQMFAPLLQVLSSEPTPKEPVGEDNEYVDPDIEKIIAKRTQHLQANVGSAQDRLDQLEFRQVVAQGDFETEDVQGAEALFREWKKRGITFGNAQPTRIDALTQYLGQKAAGVAMKTKATARTADEVRRASNQDADSESGGRYRNTVSRPDLDKMELKDRLAKGYAHLDKEGF